LSIQIRELQKYADKGIKFIKSFEDLFKVSDVIISSMLKLEKNEVIALLSEASFFRTLVRLVITKWGSKKY